MSDAFASRTAGSTIRDVAVAAGVSIRTVSRVLNRSPKVNGETRERVEAVIARLGFKRSARARGLATGRSYLIGLVHNDRNALVLDRLQRGARAANQGAAFAWKGVQAGRVGRYVGKGLGDCATIGQYRTNSIDSAGADIAFEGHTGP